MVTSFNHIQPSFNTPIATVIPTGTPLGAQNICMACRRPYPAMPGQFVRCPYCQFVSPMANQIPTGTVIGTPTFY
jgi:hypothetical protein